MNKKELFRAFLIPVSKRLPKKYEEGDPRNQILLWVPPRPCWPDGKFFVRDSILFLLQQQQLIDQPDLIDKFNKQNDVSFSGYYATHWMNLYPPEEK